MLTVYRSMELDLQGLSFGECTFPLKPGNGDSASRESGVDAPFLLPAKVPHTSEVTFGQIKQKTLQDFPFSLLPSGGSLANTSRMGDKRLPQYLFLHGRNDCRKEEEKWSNTY